MKYLKLNSGYDIPIVGLGTWRAQNQDIEKALNYALEQGYRHIDTAFNYNTELPIGNVIKQWINDGKINRKDLFITTKLPNVANKPEDVEKFLKLSLDRLQLNYVDLYLIHMPFSFYGDPITFTPLINEDGTIRRDDNNDIIATWKEMEKQVKNGKTKSIGLSNFNNEQIERIYKNSDIKPSVLQIELHAYLQQKNLIEKCKNLNIQVTAYSPLGSPGANQHFTTKYSYKIDNFPDILNETIIKKLSEKYKKTPGQILLKYTIEKDIIVIPKSLNNDRIKDNINLFDFKLTEQDLNELEGLDKGENGRIFDFLFFKGVEKHPEYPFKDRFIKSE